MRRRARIVIENTRSTLRTIRGPEWLRKTYPNRFAPAVTIRFPSMKNMGSRQAGSGHFQTAITGLLPGPVLWRWPTAPVVTASTISNRHPIPPLPLILKISLPPAGTAIREPTRTLPEVPFILLKGRRPKAAYSSGSGRFILA